MVILKKNISIVKETNAAICIIIIGMDKPFWIPKSQIKCFPNFDDANYFEIPDWLYDKKIDELFNGE